MGKIWIWIWTKQDPVQIRPVAIPNRDHLPPSSLLRKFPLCHSLSRHSRRRRFVLLLVSVGRRPPPPSVIVSPSLNLSIFAKGSPNSRNSANFGGTWVAVRFRHLWRLPRLRQHGAPERRSSLLPPLSYAVSGRRRSAAIAPVAAAPSAAIAPAAAAPSAADDAPLVRPRLGFFVRVSALALVARACSVGHRHLPPSFSLSAFCSSVPVAMPPPVSSSPPLIPLSLTSFSFSNLQVAPGGSRRCRSFVNAVVDRGTPPGYTREVGVPRCPLFSTFGPSPSSGSLNATFGNADEGKECFW